MPLDEHQDLQWTRVRKSADESVANTTLQADDELSFQTIPDVLYEWQCNLIYGSPAGAGTPDLKVGGGESGTVTGAVTVLAAINTGDTGAQTGTARDNQSDNIGIGTAAADRVAQFAGAHVGLGGVFQIWWAEATSSANPTIVRGGSVLRWRRV